MVGEKLHLILATLLAIFSTEVIAARPEIVGQNVTVANGEASGTMTFAIGSTDPISGYEFRVIPINNDVEITSCGGAFLTCVVNNQSVSVGWFSFIPQGEAVDHELIIDFSVRDSAIDGVLPFLLSEVSFVDQFLSEVLPGTLVDGQVVLEREPSPYVACSETRPIPNQGEGNGTLDFASSSFNIPADSSFAISNVRVSVELEHSNSQEVTLVLGSQSANRSITLLSQQACADDSTSIVFSDAGYSDRLHCETPHLYNRQKLATLPTERLQAFFGLPALETNFRLEFFDRVSNNDTGQVRACIELDLFDPNDPPRRLPIPTSAVVSDLAPYSECENRICEERIYFDYSLIGANLTEDLETIWTAVTLDPGTQYSFEKPPAGMDRYNARISIYDTDVLANPIMPPVLREESGCPPIANPLVSTTEDSTFSFTNPSSERRTFLIRVSECFGSIQTGKAYSLRIRPPGPLPEDPNQCPPGINCKPTGRVFGSVLDIETQNGLTGTVAVSDNSFAFANSGSFTGAFTEGNLDFTFFAPGYKPATVSAFIPASGQRFLLIEAESESIVSSDTDFLFSAGFE